MAEVTEKSTKDVIWGAYQSAQETILRLEKEAEEAASKPQSGITGENMEKVQTLLQENELLKKESNILRQLFPEVAIFDENFIEDLKEMALDEMPQEPVTVVIPYIKEFAQGNELQLALRGWGKYFKDDFNVVIIGDREDWMSKDLDVIECKRIGNNPPIDIANKMLLAIESDLVSEKFIWANDDQYLISPCVIADFETLKCDGILKAPFPNNLYGRNKQATMEQLQKAKKPVWDYSTHIPFVFEKKKLKELIVEKKLTKNGRLISSLYFNWYFPEFVPLKISGGDASDNIKIGVYRQDANLGKLKQLIPVKKLVSNSQSGWSDPFVKIMMQTLHEKCRFEN